MPIVRPKTRLRQSLTSALLGFAVLALSSCYLPVRFDAEIEIDRSGFYSMIFDGYLAQLELYQDLRQGTVTPDQEVEKVQVIKTDLTRDKAVSEFAYYGKGVSKVHWEKKGDLLRTRMVTFLRRNEAFLTLKYTEDERYLKTGKVIVMTGGGMSESQRQQLRDAGLTTTGELRLITDATARVLTHNAGEVRPMPSQPGKQVYIWRIRDLSTPRPLFVMQPG